MSNKGTREALLLSKLERSGVEVFSLDRVIEILGLSRAAASKFVHNLSVSGRVRRIQKSAYMVIPQGHSPEHYTLPYPLLASVLVDPYYLSYWSALYYYGWTEQSSKTIFIASTKLKMPVTVSGVTFRFVKLRSPRFFGFTTHRINGHKVAVAEPEKAIIDCLDQPRYCGEIVEVAKGLWNGRHGLDLDKLRRYAVRMDNGAIVKRLGFLMEKLDVGTTSFRSKLKAAKTAGYSPLDTGSRRNGTYNNDWNLFVNVSEYNLTEWIHN